MAGQLLPGPGAIYVSQSLRFRLPVFFGDTVTAYVRTQSIDREKARGVFETRCVNQRGRVVIQGEAVATIPRDLLAQDVTE